MTGVGFLTEDPLVASDDWNVSYLDSPNNLSRHKVWNDSGVYWAFVFHDVCWHLLLGQVASSSHKHWTPPDIALQLFDYVYCLPWSRSNGIPTTHGFGDVSIRPRLSSASNMGFFLANPQARLHGDSYYALFGLPTYVPKYEPLGPEYRVDPSTDRFAHLPPEIITIIINFSHISDICNFRLASKTIANIAHRGRLPQSFWASRFAPDLELGFWFAGCPPTPGGDKTDWRNLYNRVRKGVQDILPLGHTRNRRHIWLSLRHATRCLLPMLDQRPLCRDGHTVDVAPPAHGYVEGQVAQGLERHCNQPDTDRGFRLIRRDQFVLFPKDAMARRVEMRVSFLVIHCTSYICGIRTMIYCGESPAREVSRTGIILLSTEVDLNMPQRHSLTEIQVTSALDGILGLNLRLEDEAGQEYSQVAGPTGNLPEGTDVTKLRPQKGCTTAGLIIGTDVSVFFVLWELSLHLHRL